MRRSACICRLVALMAVVGLAEGFLTLPSRIPAGSASAQPGLCLVAERALPRVAARKAGGTSEVRRLRVSCSQNGGAGGADLVQQAIEKCRAAVEENPEYSPHHQDSHVDLLRFRGPVRTRESPCSGNFSIQIGVEANPEYSPVSKALRKRSR